MRGVTLMPLIRLRRRVPLQHATVTQARGRRCLRRIRQIMERKHTECYASCHTGRPSHIWKHVRYRPISIHSDHSKEASSEGNANKNMMDNHQQRTVVPKRRMIIKRTCQKINNY